jgi:hypothetical protein
MGAKKKNLTAERVSLSLPAHLLVVLKARAAKEEKKLSTLIKELILRSMEHG